MLFWCNIQSFQQVGQIDAIYMQDTKKEKEVDNLTVVLRWCFCSIFPQVFLPIVWDGGKCWEARVRGAAGTPEQHPAPRHWSGCSSGRIDIPQPPQVHGNTHINTDTRQRDIRHLHPFSHSASRPPLNSFLQSKKSPSLFTRVSRFTDFLNT